MSGLEQIFSELVKELGFIGIFLISFISTATVLIPIPYTLVIFLVSARSAMNPWIIISSAAVGSAVGETIGYLIGYSTKNVIGEKRQKKLNLMLKVLLKHKNIWPLLVFFFALTPLPDDILFIPLGLAHFPFLRVFIPCIIGKATMLTIIVYMGKSVNFLIESYITDSSFLTFIIFTTISLFLFIMTILVVWKIDWEKILNKYSPYKTTDT